MPISFSDDSSDSIDMMTKVIEKSLDKTIGKETIRRINAAINDEKIKNVKQTECKRNEIPRVQRKVVKKRKLTMKQVKANMRQIITPSQKMDMVIDSVATGNYLLYI